MRSFLIIPAFLFAIPLSSQTVTPVVVSSNGGYSQQTGGSIAWTIGEPVSETYTKSSNITTMGFHQPALQIVNFLNEESSIGELLVYPNPVKYDLQLDFKGAPDGNYSIVLNDMLGKLIFSDEFVTSGEKRIKDLPTGKLSEGSYLLQVKNKSLVKTFKIIKVN